MLLINLSVLLVILVEVWIICGQDIHSTTQGHSIAILLSRGSVTVHPKDMI